VPVGMIFRDLAIKPNPQVRSKDGAAFEETITG
jgi:hypothetical protein